MFKKMSYLIEADLRFSNILDCDIDSPRWRDKFVLEVLIQSKFQSNVCI